MLNTIGILSILEGVLLEKAKELWRLFEIKYQSKGVQAFEYPNLTFLAGHCQKIDPLKDMIYELSGKISPFEIVIDGLGQFDSPSKVIYLRVKPTDELLYLNKIINEMLSKYCEDIFDYYRPNNWIPHVTLAMTDLTDENFEKAMADLNGYNPFFQQIINNIHLVQLNSESKRMEIINSSSLA